MALVEQREMGRRQAEDEPAGALKKLKKRIRVQKGKLAELEEMFDETVGRPRPFHRGALVLVPKPPCLGVLLPEVIPLLEPKNSRLCKPGRRWPSWSNARWGADRLMMRMPAPWRKP